MEVFQKYFKTHKFYVIRLYSMSQFASSWYCFCTVFDCTVLSLTITPSYSLRCWYLRSRRQFLKQHHPKNPTKASPSTPLIIPNTFHFTFRSFQTYRSSSVIYSHVVLIYSYIFSPLSWRKVLLQELVACISNLYRPSGNSCGIPHLTT